MKSKAPSCVARTAVSIVPCPLIITTGSVGPAPRISSSTAMPSRPGIAMSSSTRSGARSRTARERLRRRPRRARSRSPRRRGCPPASGGCSPRRRRSGCAAALPQALPHRQLDDEARAARPVRVDAHVAVMVGDDARDDREAEPRAVRLRREVRLEDARGGPRRGCRRRRPRPRCARSRERRVVARARRRPRPRRRPFRARDRGDGVVDQVREHAAQLLAIEVDARQAPASRSVSNRTPSLPA